MLLPPPLFEAKGGGADATVGLPQSQDQPHCIEQLVEVLVDFKILCEINLLLCSHKLHPETFKKY